VSVTFSVPTLDEAVWRTTEPGTAPPTSRLEAVRRLAEAGLDVGVGLAPILPGLSDSPDRLRAVVHAAKSAGATTVWAAPVHLRPGVREHFLAALARDWPELVGTYEQLFAERAYLPSSIATPIREHVRAAARAAPLREGYRRVERQPQPQLGQLSLAV
jgi:DNA repair photolyase